MSSAGAGNNLKAGKVGRASRTLGQLWQVPAFFAGIVALVLVAATAPLRRDYSSHEFDESLDQFRLVLTGKQGRIADSLPVADELLAGMEKYPRKAGLIHFLVGSLQQRLAERAPLEDTDRYHRKALEHLKQALALGVPEEDRPALFYRLGLVLYQLGTDPDKAIEYLSKGVDGGSDQSARGYGILVQLYLAQPKVDLDAALAANHKQLLYTEDEAELHKARLVRGELLFRKGKRKDALSELAAIGPQVPRELRLKARQLQTRCCDDEGWWERAIPLYKELLADAAAVPGGKSRILFSLGRCYSRSEPPQLEEARLSWRETIKMGGEEGQAAGLLLGEALLSADSRSSANFQADQVLAELGQALEQVNRPSDYKNSLVPLDLARKILDKTWGEFQARKDFFCAEKTAILYKKIADRGRADERLAQTRKAWAENLQDQADKGTATDKSGVEADTARSKAREQFLRAGQAFEQAADALPLDDQPPLLWNSAQCYLVAKDVSLAIGLLRRFVDIHNSEEAVAKGYLALADALQSIGQKDQARDAFHKCIELPSTPYAYRARYQLAVDAVAEGNLQHAEDILKQNLTVTGPSVDREAHGKSLYKYASLLFERKYYEQASLQLKEAIQQYPNDAQAKAARDHLGHCYRQMAEDVDSKLKGSLTPEHRKHLTGSRRTWLEEATRVYQDLADDLERQAGSGSPPPSPSLSAEDQLLYRKAAFAVADLRKDLNEFPEALRRYQVLLDKYRGELDGLLACRQIWSCARVMSSLSPENTRSALDAARDAVQKTLADVERMGPEHPAFKGQDRTNQEQWRHWLRQENDRLEALANPPPLRSPALQ